MPYTDSVPHAGSAEVLFTGMLDEPAGTIARTLPRWSIGTGNLAVYTTGGQVGIRFLPLPQGLVVSNITTFFGGTGATGPTHYWLGLVDQLLNVLAVSADQGAAAQAAQTAAGPLAMLTRYVIPQTGLYGIAASSSSSTTAPTAAGNGLVTGIAGSALGAPILCGTAGNQATPPAVGSQLNGGVLTGSGTENFAAWIS